MIWMPNWLCPSQIQSNLYWRYLVVLISIYFGLFGFIFAVSDFLPYIMDNNETFSSIIHAKSIYDFGLAKSFGLTDESYGINAESHPFVYTHQGNFPRFPALFLYALGAKSAESQILIHTFTIGLASIIMAYYFFSRHAQPLFALVACLVLITDYIFFVQWNVVTWRVWHHFFLFAGLLCAEGLSNPRTVGRYALVTFVLWICLFYFELIYAAFISITIGLYAIYLYRKRISTIVFGAIVMVAGAIVSVGILIIQGILFYGWDDFLTDARLTFVARNWANDPKSHLTKLEEFFGERNVVFWYNVVDSSNLFNFRDFFGSLTWNIFSVYTPFITITVLMLAFGWCVGLTRRIVISSSQARQSSPFYFGRKGRFEFTLGFNRYTSHKLFPYGIFIFLMIVYVLVAWRFAGLVLIDGRSLGLNPITFTMNQSVTNPITYWWSTLAATACLVLLPTLAAWNGSNIRRTDSLGLVAGIIFLLTFYYFISYFYQVYDVRLLPIWKAYSGSYEPFMYVMIILIAALSISLMMKRPARMLRSIAHGGLLNLVVLVACSFLAYIIIYRLTPGYLLTGYLHRNVPFNSYFVSLIMAFAVGALLFLGRINLGHIFSKSRYQARQSLSKMIGLVSLGCALVLSIYWLGLQNFYYQHLPPDHFAFLKKLELPPFKGKSFVVDTYAAPVAIATGQWAYFDYKIGGANIIKTVEGPRIIHDPTTYAWFADKKYNDSYKRPDYFICIAPQNLLTMSSRLSNDWKLFGGTQVDCNSVNLIRALTEDQVDKRGLMQNNKLLARDESTRNRWAIIRLDWNIPPAVKVPEDPLLSPVSIDIKGKGGEIWLIPIYKLTAATTDATPQLPRLTLYKIGEDNDGCGGPDKPDERINVVEADSIALPNGFRGRFRVGVQPRSNGSVGGEEYSAIYRINPQGGVTTINSIVKCAAQLPLTPKFLTVKRSSDGSMVTINWARADHAVTYQVEMNTNKGNFMPIANLENWKFKHVVANLAPKGQYCFRVRACSPIGCSPYSQAIKNDGISSAVCSANEQNK